VQRNGVVIPPIESVLPLVALSNLMGGTMTKAAGYVTFPLNTFDLGADVVVTAIPYTGTTIVKKLSKDELLRVF